jgi:hypothetical protein
MGKYLNRIIELSEVSENHTSLIYTREEKPEMYGLSNTQNTQKVVGDSKKFPEMYGFTNPQNFQNSETSPDLSFGDGIVEQGELPPFDFWREALAAIDGARRGNHLAYTPELASAWRAVNEIVGGSLSSAALCALVKKHHDAAVMEREKSRSEMRNSALESNEVSR